MAKLVALIVTDCVYQNVNRTSTCFYKSFLCIFLLLCKVLNTKFSLSKLHWLQETNVSLENHFYFVFFNLCSLLLLYRDIESNPWPRNSKNHLPSFCHWNLNSLPAHNIAKMLLWKAYNALYISTIYMFVWNLSWFFGTIRSRFLRFGGLYISWFTQTILIMLNEVEFVCGISTS